jgi:hypothetical protein
MRNDIAPHEHGSIIPQNYYINRQVRRHFDAVKHDQLMFWDGFQKLTDYYKMMSETITLMTNPFLGSK